MHTFLRQQSSSNVVLVRRFNERIADHFNDVLLDAGLRSIRELVKMLKIFFALETVYVAQFSLIHLTPNPCALLHALLTV
jgi:hypothetical protein